MKYLLLGYTPASAWDAAIPDLENPEAQAAFAVYQRFEAELRQSGEFVSSEGLGHPVTGVTVRKTADGVTATDGPFAELKEVLASFAIVDVVDADRAVEIAGRIVELLGEPIEIRPILGDDLG